MDSIKILAFDEGNQFSSELTGELIKRGFSLQVLGMDELLSAVSKEPPEIALFNFSSAPAPEKIGVIQEIRTLEEHLPILILAPNSDVATAVAFMKAGATDFLILPTNLDLLEENLRRASQVYQLTKRVFQVEQKQASKGDFFGIVGQSSGMQDNFKTIAKVAKTNATILIQGESGQRRKLGIERLVRRCRE